MESWHTGHWTLRIRDTSDLKNSYRTVRTLIIYKLAYNFGHRLEVFRWLKCLNTPWHQVRGASCMVFGSKVSQVWSVPGPKWTVSDLLVADRSSRDYTRLESEVSRVRSGQYRTFLSQIGLRGTTQLHTTAVDLQLDWTCIITVTAA